MGYKQWASGDVLYAADVNNYLMEQAVIVCTSGTRPSTGGAPLEGMTIYETDTDRLLTYTGSAWQRVSAVSSTGWTGGRWSRVATQSVTASTETPISWDTETRDSDTLLAHHATTGTTFTVPSGLAGRWSFVANWRYSGDPQNHWGGFKVTAGGVDEYHGIIGFSDAALMGPTSNQGPVGTSITISLSAADTVQVVVYYDSGTARTVTSQRFEAIYHGQAA